VNLLDLRTELQTLLAPVLGYYTLPNGITTAAFAVRSSGENLPGGTTATGLEAVLIRDPDLQAIPQYRLAGAIRTRTLFLIDWSDAVDLEPVGAFLIRTYPGTSVSTLAVPRSGGPQNQMRVTLQFSSEPVTGLTAPGVYESGVFIPEVFL
jgi:hypothetical protein